MRKMETIRDSKLNNQGMSLLEVLIAIVILCIVAIPFMHAFVTSAITNAKAKSVLNATQTAENIMEDFNSYSVEELVTKYSKDTHNIIEPPNEATGKIYYNFEIRKSPLISTELTNDYYVNVTLDPTLYKNANAVNLADLKTVSAADSAVYTMQPQFDTGVYQYFKQKNETANSLYPLNYELKDEDYFKDNLKRLIQVVVSQNGSTVDVEGNTKPLVKVEMSIIYQLDTPEKDQVLPQSDQKYVTAQNIIFNNENTKVPLSSVFILYNPRYKAAQIADREQILVKNWNNINFNLFVVAEDTLIDQSLKNNYYSNPGLLQLILEEQPLTAITSPDYKAAMALQTNLNSGAPFNSSQTDASLYINLLYRNATKSQQLTGDDAGKALQMKDVDGKALFHENTKNRIYKIKVEVLKNGASKPVVKLDGTKLE